VVRYGRYTLVELAPTEAQRNLMLQVVDVAVPDTLDATVGDALRHVLQRSGYQLCSGPQTDALNALPLPAAHYRLGPIVLRDALLTLAGPAWELHADDGARQVCFSQVITPVDPLTPLPAPIKDAETPAEAFPLVEESQP
jgi:type IV pili sensor histidine kinase/response regulator